MLILCLGLFSEHMDCRSNARTSHSALVSHYQSDKMLRYICGWRKRKQWSPLLASHKTRRCSFLKCLHSFRPHYLLSICKVLKIYPKPTEISADLQLHRTAKEPFLLSLPHLHALTRKLLRCLLFTGSAVLLLLMVPGLIFLQCTQRAGWPAFWVEWADLLNLWIYANIQIH